MRDPLLVGHKFWLPKDLLNSEKMKKRNDTILNFVTACFIFELLTHIKEFCTKSISTFSGSTFLGELFNENPDAFYLFEPLAGIQGEHSTLGCAKNPTKKLSLLRRYFECDTPSFYQSVPVLDVATKKLKLDKNRIIHGGKVKSRTSEMPSNAIEMEMPEHGRCARSNLCFRENHNWSCDTGICKVPQDKQSSDK